MMSNRRLLFILLLICVTFNYAQSGGALTMVPKRTSNSLVVSCWRRWVRKALAFVLLFEFATAADVELLNQLIQRCRRR